MGVTLFVSDRARDAFEQQVIEYLDRHADEMVIDNR